MLLNRRLLVCMVLALGAQAGAIELKPLIVGDTMPGWEDTGGKATWSIHDGMLSCAGGKGGGWFGSKAEYTDFIIDLEFKLPAGGNSGVFLRVPKTGKPYEVGMEVQILDDYDAQYKDIKPAQHCGSLYMIEPPARSVLRHAGEWQHMRVLADSDYIHVELNGETVVDTDGNIHPEIFKRSPRGPVGLQNHETGVSFRNIRFADLAADRSERMRWWHEAKFGMFIHWGIYAVRGEGEWVMNYGSIPAAEYGKLASQFNPTAFDPGAWVSLAKRAGMGYIVITTKHHDGFAMYGSKTSDYNVVDRTPYKRDVCKLLADECARQGIRLGFYHSILDWHEPDYLPAPGWDPSVRPASQRDFNRYLDYLQSMLRELCTGYGPVACIWWDGGADHKSPSDKARLSQIDRMIRELQPGVIINDRANRLEDFVTPEQFIPPTGIRHLDGSHPAWESCMTMTTGHGSFPSMAWWGYDKNEREFKNAATCIRMLVDVVSKGGNLLLNVGPDATGRIGSHETEALDAIGQWLRVNGAAIYGTTASPFKRLPFDGRATIKENTLYLHVFDWPEDHRLVLPGLRNDVVSTRLLADGKAVATKREGEDVVIELPRIAPDPMVTVVALALDGAPQADAPSIRPDRTGRIVLDALDAHLPLETGLHFRLEERAGHVHIGRWVDLKDTAIWQVTFPRGGQYDVTLTYAEGEHGTGAACQFVAESAGHTSSLKINVEATGGVDHFANHDAGTINLPPGRATLSLTPMRIPKNGQLMNLRQIVLVPAGARSR